MATLGSSAILRSARSSVKQNLEPVGKRGFVPKVAAHGAYELASNRQTEPDSLRWPGIALGKLFEVFEDPLFVGWRNAWPVVRDHHTELSTVPLTVDE